MIEYNENHVRMMLHYTPDFIYHINKISNIIIKIRKLFEHDAFYYDYFRVENEQITIFFVDYDDVYLDKIKFPIYYLWSPEEEIETFEQLKNA